MKKRLLALMLAGAFVMQSSAALAAELDVSEDVIEEDIVLTEDTEEDSGLVVDETAPKSGDATVEDDVQSITVQETATSGKCGTDVNWAYADGTLTISGEGAMDDYVSWSSRPWDGLGESITKVVVEAGVTEIGNEAFGGLLITTATLGKDVTRIGEGAFAECYELESINIPDGVTAIEGYTFGHCDKLNELVLPESVRSLGGSSLENISKLTLTVRNPDCQISKYMGMHGRIVRGHEDSTAETYANAYSNITFEAIHIWDNGTVKTAPTCTEKGVKTYKCKYCTATKTEDIDPIKHDWGDWKVITPATCTEDGVETRTCKNDSTHTEARPIEATNHDWGDWKVTTPATCNKDGVETHTCKNDSTHTETRKILPTGKHTYATTITKAKPGKDGSIVKKCTVCGKIESKTAISAPEDCPVENRLYLQRQGEESDDHRQGCGRQDHLVEQLHGFVCDNPQEHRHAQGNGHLQGFEIRRLAEHQVCHQSESTVHQERIQSGQGCQGDMEAGQRHHGLSDSAVDEQELQEFQDNQRIQNRDLEKDHRTEHRNDLQKVLCPRPHL